MGPASVHPQYLNQLPQPSLMHSHSKDPPDYASEPDNPDCSCHIVPSMTIRQSPFKNYRAKFEEITHPEEGPDREGQQGSQPYPESEGESKAAGQALWGWALYDTKIVGLLWDMLEPHECLHLALLNKRLSSQFYFYRLFHRPNNWSFTHHCIRQRILKPNKLSYLKMLNECQEESEHSLDLDRLDSLFEAGEDAAEQVARLDRVMRAIGKSGLGYFQGLNCILIVLLGYFSDEVAYWVALALIHKTESIHDDPQLYEQLMGKIDREVKDRCPGLYKRLGQLDLDVGYFAMRWVMGLFSADLARGVVMQLWDLLISFGLASLKWFTVSVFMQIQANVDVQHSDQLNDIVKGRLKDIIKGERALQVLQATRVLMAEEMFGQGCSEIIKPWSHYCEQQQSSIHMPMEVPGRSRAMIEPINQQEGENEVCQTDEHVEQETSYQTLQSEKADETERAPNDHEEDPIPIPQTEQIKQPEVSLEEHEDKTEECLSSEQDREGNREGGLGAS